MTRRIVIAGTGSSVGKSSITLGLMGAFRHKGYTVQGFKCGPDYIDPTYHSSITGRVSRNLDSWMMKPSVLREIYVHGSQGADISVIEGVMGMYDGREASSNTGSTAEVSALLEAPVLLVVNGQSMGRSAAAVVKGFCSFDGGSQIAGVIINRTGSESHYQLIKEAIEQECGIPVVGHMKRDTEVVIPERHLGLVPSVERGELQPLFDRLASLAETHLDLEAIWRLSEVPAVQAEAVLFGSSMGLSQETGSVKPSVKIAVAKDAAFHFYYPENLELLEQAGAELAYFSPLAGEKLPEDAAGLYIGGGFPEEFAEELSANAGVRQSIRSAIEAGLPVIAECGGFMYLADKLQKIDGSLHEMAGVFPGTTVMHAKRAALGYREVRGLPGNPLLIEGMTVRGHEYHYSTFEPDLQQKKLPSAYETEGRLGKGADGFVYKNTVAGYTHIHFASCPSLADRWLDLCRQWQSGR
jgi:cobyrinic acid a,c-diamide synthase